MGFILKAAFVVLVVIVSVMLDVIVRLIDWSLTPSGQARRVETMTSIDTVNQELHLAFGDREAAGDPDEADTEPYTSEAQRAQMVAEALAYADTELDIDVVVQDEFV